MLPSFPAFSVVSQPFKRSQLGLFQGKTKQYGNNVPFSKHKTRRTWLPNVQRKRLFSDTLGENVRVKVTTRALRTIKKYDGLDNYVLKTRADKLSWEGMRIRLMVREDAEKKAAGEADKTDNDALSLPNSETEAPRTDVKDKEKERQIALEELRILQEHTPTLESAREDRLKAKVALNLDYLPTSAQTIQYLRDRRQRLLKLLR